MGGDFGPRVVLRGANIARKRYPHVEFLLYGNEKKIKPLLKRYLKLAKVCQIIHTDETITNTTKPSVAIRTGRQSSMALAIDAVKEKKADGVVSAGNTGALMALARLVLKMLPGVDRPAISSFIPSLTGDVTMLDLGANTECKERNYIEFSFMGSLFSKHILGLKKPTVGLLNIGSEDIKGHEILKQSHQIFQNTKGPFEYKGFVEGNDIMEGKVNVVVTDGFTGNVALKSMEGATKLISEYIYQGFRHSLLAKLGIVFVYNALRKLKLRLDIRRYNGAVLLGVNGIVVKSHGGTDHLGFAHAIGVAIDMAMHDYNQQLLEEFKNLDMETKKVES